MPSRTVFTMAASARITTKTAINRALISYVDEAAASGSNIRVTVGYRLASTSFGLWDVNNSWLMPGTAVDPATSAWNRFHVQYNGTTRRELFVNGSSVRFAEHHHRRSIGADRAPYRSRRQGRQRIFSGRNRLCLSLSRHPPGSVAGGGVCQSQLPVELLYRSRRRRRSVLGLRFCQAGVRDEPAHQ